VPTAMERERAIRRLVSLVVSLERHKEFYALPCMMTGMKRSRQIEMVALLLMGTLRK